VQRPTLALSPVESIQIHRRFRAPYPCKEATMVTMKMAKTARLRVQADGRLQAEDYARHTPQLDRLARMADVFFPSPIRFFAHGDTA